MLPKSTVSLLLFLTTLTARGGIDLTPSVNEYVAQGIKVQQLTFKEDKRRIEYEPPSGWKFDGGPNQLHLVPPQKNFAEAVVAVAQLNKPQSLDESTIKLLEQQFVANLPTGSQFVKIEQEISNPVLLDGNASFEITVSYQSTGEKFLRSALFVNLRDTQLVFRLTARKDDFQSLHREFRASIFSWHWIDEGETPAQAGQAASLTTAH